MIYWLLYPLASQYQIFNILRYITVRTAGATLTSLCIAFIIGPYVIRWLKSKQKYGQPIRIDGPETHLVTKKGTPTMGGFLILGSIIFTVLLWGNLVNPYTWIIMLVLCGFGIIGCIDDYIKLTKKNSKGISARTKFCLQIIIGTIVCFWIMSLSPEKIKYGTLVPFFKDFIFNLGCFYIPFVLVVIVGSSNAVNLTDGLDGLAIVPVMICSVCFCIIAYLVGHIEFAHYLHIEYIANVGEISIFCGAIIGAGLGFLWFNAPPAMIFMGDTGSLSLGGVLGTIAVITKQEFILLVIGGVFVIEALSVIIQIGYFRISGGKRIFLMAPIHHHYEKKGWAEPTIVIRFWIISIVLALIGMITLKLR